MHCLFYGEKIGLEISCWNLRGAYLNTDANVKCTQMINYEIFLPFDLLFYCATSHSPTQIFQDTKVENWTT
jgi:hypothetical protein